MARQLKLYLFILCAMFAFLTEALPRQAAEPESLEADSSTLIGWRLLSKIILRGAIVGADRLREIAGGIELETDATAEDEGDPTPLMQAVVSTLSGLDGGRVEVRGRELSVVGIAEVKKIGGLKARIEGLARRDVRIGELRIDPRDRAPYLWTASRSFNTLELSGFVADEGARAKLIGIARGLSDELIVVDGMTVKSGLPSNATAAAAAGLAQLSLLEKGLVWIYGDRVDLLGWSLDIATRDDRAGCRALTKVMPKGIECGTVSIAHWGRRHYRRHYGYSGRRHYNGEALPSPKPKPFAAIDPNKFVNSGLIDSSSDPRIVDILFATLRKVDDTDAPAATVYSSERSESLNFGRARVRIPEDHKIGRLELPGGFSIFGYELTHEKADPKRHFILRSRQALTMEEWDSLIDTIGPNDAVIFVHGFNTSFDDAVVRFAQIAWDLQYKGLPVLFSWASKGSVADYPYDRESALVARDGFLELLANLSQKHKITKVHVIAHSMGNFLVLDALAHQADPRGGMAQLIMAAPDIDRDQFLQDIPKVKQFFQGLTLYASSSDKALAVSKLVAGGIPRAGDVPPGGPIVLPGLETLDVSALGEEMFGLNHNTFAQTRPLIDDIQLILREGRRAPRLAEERPMPENASVPTYWRFAP